MKQYRICYKDGTFEFINAFNMTLKGNAILLYDTTVYFDCVAVFNIENIVSCVEIKDANIKE